jgi:3-dehydroquinate dehydratase-2
MEIYVLNGPNLNLLGKREPDIYGLASLADLEKKLQDEASSLDSSIGFKRLLIRKSQWC